MQSIFSPSFHRRAAQALVMSVAALGATAVLIAMMVMGPAIATLLPRHPEMATGTLALLPAWLALLAPIIAGFFLAQFLTHPRLRRTLRA